MDASPLGRLPPELRHIVFNLVLLTPKLIDVGMTTPIYGLSGPFFGSGMPPAQDVLALTATCKQMRSEIIPVFYSANEFVINVSALAEETCENAIMEMVKSQALLLRGWLQSLGQNASCLRKVIIHAGAWETVFLDALASSALTAWAVDLLNTVFDGTMVKTTFRSSVRYGDRDDCHIMPVLLCPPYNLQQQQAMAKAIEARRQREWDIQDDYNKTDVRRSIVQLDADKGELLQLFEALRALRTMV
ncbi:hypothetical protein LTR36_002001 [Oleoguttula mirabilis]|uniref:F-box domain-containing protein n=1 Tax=Oleoguttula mirabilis TaxID=1507867 RepID=A0AAV9JMT3_9PEZI|nr:hypothetical protein LTR36_002001 [Oleoguttula mirabilis]